MDFSQLSRHVLKPRGPFGPKVDNLHGWVELLQMLLELILDLVWGSVLFDPIGCLSVWSRNLMRHNEDILSVCGVFVTFHIDRGESSWYYISMSFAQLSRRVLKS